MNKEHPASYYKLIYVLYSYYNIVFQILSPGDLVKYNRFFFVQHIGMNENTMVI